MHILVTGAAGFIGFHTSLQLLDRGDTVVGLDNLNDYYEVSLKEDRLALLKEKEGFTFARLALEDRPALEALFEEHRFDAVINLAAQAGVDAALDRAIAADPGFALAHIAKARQAQMCADRPTLTHHLAAARAAEVTTDREAAHIDAMGLLLEGKVPTAYKKTKSISSNHHHHRRRHHHRDIGNKTSDCIR